MFVFCFMTRLQDGLIHAIEIPNNFFILESEYSEIFSPQNFFAQEIIFSNITLRVDITIDFND